MACNLKVLVIGAGIGGLTAAVALRQQGHLVEVFERSRFATEVGAAVQTAPNCTWILNRLGLFPENFDGVPCKGMVLRDSNLGIKTQMPVKEDHRKRWHADNYLVHRVDLHNALKQKATAPNDPGMPVELHTNCPVVDVDVATTTITFANGSTATGDLIVAADGVHSVAREAVTGKNYPTRSTGKCCFRFLVPHSSVVDDPELQPIVAEPGVITEVEGGSRRVLFYACSRAQLMNCVVFAPTEVVGAFEHGWNRPGNKEKLLRSFSGYSPTVLRLLEKAPEDEVAIWDLLDMDILPTWVRGRVALLGDAAHPFLPYLGQGAAQAIEDAATLGALLPLGTTADDTTSRLQLYEKCRKERVDWLQDAARERGKDGEQYDNRDFASALVRSLSHNAWDHAVAALQRRNEGSKLRL